MATYVVRVWLPDRPGALGAVASRVGALRGEITGIDILERGAGRAIDELVVDVPDDERIVALMIREICEVDGVDVEEVRRVATPPADPRVDALESAVMLVEQPTQTALLDSLVARTAHDFDADWVVAVDFDSDCYRSAVGSPPPASWMRAFVTGSAASQPVVEGDSGPDDIALAGMAFARLGLVAGRACRPFRARERRQLAALARIADVRYRDLAVQPARRLHPSTTR